MRKDNKFYELQKELMAEMSLDELGEYSCLDVIEKNEDDMLVAYIDSFPVDLSGDVVVEWCVNESQIIAELKEAAADREGDAKFERARQEDLDEETGC